MLWAKLLGGHRTAILHSLVIAGLPSRCLSRYAPRRVECAEHGIVVEQILWSEGKRPVPRAMMGFLARWARRLSWRDTAHVFATGSGAVYRSVEWFCAFPAGGDTRRGLREDRPSSLIYSS